MPINQDRRSSVEEQHGVLTLPCGNSVRKASSARSGSSVLSTAATGAHERLSTLQDSR